MCKVSISLVSSQFDDDREDAVEDAPHVQTVQIQFKCPGLSNHCVAPRKEDSLIWGVTGALGAGWPHDMQMAIVHNCSQVHK